MMKIGIMGAMEEEIALIRKEMQITKIMIKARMEFIQGQLEDKEIVLVHSGIGKVNAAVCTQILIDYFAIDALIFTGVAGSVDEKLNIGDIIISQDTLQHDVDATAFGYESGQIPRLEEKVFAADLKLVQLALEASQELNFAGHKPQVIVGRILSGDQFIACADKVKWLRETFAGHCTEMEGAAVGQVCLLNELPFVIIRSLSDKADGSAHMDYNQFVEHAAYNSYQIVKNMIKNHS